MALGLALLIVLLAPAGARAAQAPALEFVAPSTLAASAGKPSKVFLRNAGSTRAAVHLRLLSSAGSAQVSPKSVSIAPLRVSPVEITLTPKEKSAAQSGELVASAPGFVSATLSYSVPTPSQWADWLGVYAIVFGSLLLAAGLVRLRWQRIGTPPNYPSDKDKDSPSDRDPPYQLGDLIGPVQWSFSESWASNLTAVGALLATIISAGLLSESGAVPASAYAVLALLFGLLVVVGPFYYSATEKAKLVHRTKKVEVPQYQGTLGSFLIAAAITLWAVIGEIATSFAIFYELHRSSSLPVVLVVVLALVMVGALYLVVRSAWYTLRQTIVSQREVVRIRRAHIETHRDFFPESMNESEEEGVEPPLRAWSPL